MPLYFFYQLSLKREWRARRAIYCIKTAAEQPEVNLSLREWLLRASPDLSRKLPEFDEEIDSIATYFGKVKESIDGLNRWRVERNLTLGAAVCANIFQRCTNRRATTAAPHFNYFGRPLQLGVRSRPNLRSCAALISQNSFVGTTKILSDVQKV